MNAFKSFFTDVKSGKKPIDELSLFLVSVSLVLCFLIIVLGYGRFTYLTWGLLIVAYWRSFSKNKLARLKENQRFIKCFYPIKSVVINQFRKITRRDTHAYLSCKQCRQILRIPKRTPHIKITCPKCSYSYVKKTMRGYAKLLDLKLLQRGKSSI